MWATVSGFRQTTGLSWNWSITVPYGAASTFTLPALATGIDQYNFVAGDTGDTTQLLTAKVPGGYDKVRAKLLSLSTPEQLPLISLGATGRIVYETLQIALPARTAPKAVDAHRAPVVVHW